MSCMSFLITQSELVVLDRGVLFTRSIGFHYALTLCLAPCVCLAEFYDGRISGTLSDLLISDHLTNFFTSLIKLKG